MDEINEFFYEGLDSQSSILLYGSAATGNWIPDRSDLDLIILIPREKLELLGDKVRKWVWSSKPKYPILDGYALSRSMGGFSVKRLDELAKVTYPSDTKIDLIDQWMIKNRSKHLYGNESISDLFPEISHGQLNTWVKEKLEYIVQENPKGIVPDSAVVLSKLIWSISWSARMLMLSKGNVCESKREALKWLASEYSEIRSLVYLLLDDYLKSDEVPASITSEQSMKLREFCLGLLLQESKSLQSR